MGKEQKLKFSNEAKIRRQMAKRGWTDQQLLEAMQTVGIVTRGKAGQLCATFIP